MKLTEYFADKPRGAQRELAEKLGISKTWMTLITNGHQVPSAALAVLIHQVTNGRVTREELRPDLFGGLK
jgi:DNA-binding transcriptional regulator YdaS (Cro superfamily)